jgi:hypothetical protein
MLKVETEKARCAIEVYCKLHAISPTFPLSEPDEIQALYKENRPFPYHLGTGCYMFYDQSGVLLYVGKVSGSNSMSSRLAGYFRWGKNEVGKRSHVVPFHSGWTSVPVWVQVVRVHEPYQAPSLEEYLIRELRPSDNDRLKTRG